MKIRYTIEIKDPKNHILSVKIQGTKDELESELCFFLPSWSPGSYLMREYSRNIRTFSAQSTNGEHLFYEKTDKSAYTVSWDKSDLKKMDNSFEIKYDIYCHELTVRTSFIDEEHAFIHGPSVFMGIQNIELIDPVLEIKFPSLWSKVHTGLKEISTRRDEFIFTAKNYDDFIDCPIELGCHESDGFIAFGKEHYVTFYGDQYSHDNDLKADIKTIVETVGSHFNRIPYENYLFMTHFKRNLYGGLEHKNSTALQYDGRKLKNREDYINWLCLVSHEYFHTWNVKRIRPIELGPFDYRSENYTRMHWLTEGLTSFMDELLVFRSGLISLSEYLQMQVKNLNRYNSIPGKKFHSLEDSSYDAWIKLYRPDENSNNSSISYYLKGGLVFSTLHFELFRNGKNINDLLNLLWQRYEDDKEVGVTKQEVLDMITSIGDTHIRDQFDERLSTTIDIDFESYYKDNGMEFIFNESNVPYFGADLRFEDQRIFISKVLLDGPAFQAGLNAGDEIVAIDGLRYLKSDHQEMHKVLSAGKTYKVEFARFGKLNTTQITLGKVPATIKEIKVIDEKKAKALFS